jgi:hypothetical protein
MNPETDLIEQARKAGQTYIDSFNGDLDAMIADLNRRALSEGRTVIELPPKPPHPWQLPKVGAAMSAEKRAS